jgi:hemerythrin-like domain-containing protein
MLEHAVAERLLLIYQEGLRRLRASEAVSAAAFNQAAGLLRRVIEDYHQKHEEDNIFPHFESQAEFAALVKTLRAQHAAGRKLTDTILDSASVEKFAQPEARKALVRACEAYLRMARPHMAQEATKVLQALYDVLPEEKIDGIGALFQQQEKQLFGEDGLDKVLEDIDRLEAELQIGALDVFTPSDV